MELELRTKTILEVKQEGGHEEYLGLLFDEYSREIAALVGEIRGLQQVAPEFSKDLLMQELISTHIAMLRRHISMTSQIKMEIAKVLGVI